MSAQSQPLEGRGSQEPALSPDAQPSGPDRLLLKWGTLKGWDIRSEGAREALRRYADTGDHAYGAAQQRDTDEQKEALCAVIDAIDGTITNDWSGEQMTKDEAKAYVREYGKGK